MAENNNISGVEAIRQLIKAQKNWHVFRAKKEDGKNTIYIGDTSLTEEELVNIKSGGNVDEKIGEIEEQLESTNNSIGDIESALNTILEIQNALLPAPTFTFTIDGITYNTNENMSWDDWCASDYNTLGLYWSDMMGGYFLDGLGFLWFDGVIVAPEADIVINGEYEIRWS